MEGQNHKITLNNQQLSGSELKNFCTIQMSSAQTPEWERKVYAFILDWISDSSFIIQASSGTTGTKKEFRLPKSAMVESARRTCEYFELGETVNALLCLPIDYIAGKMMVVRAFVSGMNLLLTEPSGTPDLSAFNTIDFCAMVPMQVYQILETGTAISKIKKLIIGGGEIRKELEDRLQKLETEVFATFGMAETSSHVALQRINGIKRSPHFTAIPGVHFETDERNCLVIHARFLEQPVITNDVVQFIDPYHFRWLGRFDNLINSGGLKIIPEELETEISALLGRDCAVIGLPDPKLGTRLTLVLENMEQNNGEQIAALLKVNLPKHLLPKEIRFTENLPRNASFKVDRVALIQLLTTSEPT